MDEGSGGRVISVALCTFNGGRFLGDQLRSIGRQSRPPDELVVCDDGSSDNTLDVIEDFVRTAPFPVRLVVNDRRLGSTKNFENAISLCRGSLIALADQDDVWHPEKLSLQERVMCSEELDAVFSDAEVVGPDLEPLGYRVWDAVAFSTRERALLRSGRALRLLLRRDVVMGATLLFSARQRDAVLPMPDGWVHDAWIALVVAALGRLGFVERPLVKYRQHGHNQIGAAKRSGGFLSELSAARQSDGGIFIRQAERYRAARERLREMGPLGIETAVLTAIEAKAAHLERRADLQEGRLGRFPFVVRELLSGRYHRYSEGWRSVGKDLLRVA